MRYGGIPPKMNLGGQPPKSILKSDDRTPIKRKLDELTLPFRQYDKDVSDDIVRTYKQFDKKYPSAFNKTLSVLDVATDIGSLGNFIPLPQAQLIGKLSSAAGALIDGYQAVEAARKGDYGDAAVNAASMIIPGVIAKPSILGLAKRSNKYIDNGNLAAKYGRTTYLPVDKLYGRMKTKELIGNRALLGSLLAETVYDSKSNTKNINSNKKALGGVISTFGALIQPVAQAIEGDGTNIGRSILSGGLQSGVVGAAMKGFQAYQANKLQKEQARKQGGIDMQNVQDNSANTYKQLALNPVGYYAQGGAVEGQYEAEKGEVALGDAQFEQAKEIAPGIQEIGGKSHEEGGTMGQGGNFIFSNKLFLNPLDVQLLKTVNINADEKTPYSDAVKKLANITKKYSVASNRYRTSNTNNAMLGRVNMILQGLAENQEQAKQQ
jgi:hypothetical protein